MWEGYNLISIKYITAWSVRPFGHAMEFYRLILDVLRYKQLILCVMISMIRFIIINNTYRCTYYDTVRLVC